MKKNLFYILLITFFQSIAQENISKQNIYKKEFSIISENDNYTLQGRDGYYTNGFYIKCSWANNKVTNAEKIINSLQLGQAIYNPVSYNRPYPQIQDRPFTGYLSIDYQRSIFYKQNNLLQWQIALGTIGPNSLAENVQRWYHRVIGIYDVKGWSYQLNNEINVNFNATYYQSFLKRNSFNHWLNADFIAKAQLGNAFTNIGTGLLFRIGQMEEHANSCHWNARIGTANTQPLTHHDELYFFYQPYIYLQAYNTILQGGLFVKDKGPIKVDIEPIVFTQQFGIRYAQNRWATALTYINRTKEAKNQVRNENYCSIQLSYLIK